MSSVVLGLSFVINELLTPFPGPYKVAHPVCVCVCVCVWRIFIFMFQFRQTVTRACFLSRTTTLRTMMPAMTSRTSHALTPTHNLLPFTGAAPTATTHSVRATMTLRRALQVSLTCWILYIDTTRSQSYFLASVVAFVTHCIYFHVSVVACIINSMTFQASLVAFVTPCIYVHASLDAVSLVVTVWICMHHSLLLSHRVYIFLHYWMLVSLIVWISGHHS